MAAAGVGGLAVAGLTLWSRPARAASANYYVDAAAGNDAADGTSTTRAWASLARVQAAISAGAVAAGSTIRLRRGRRYPGIIRSGSVGTLRFESWGDEPEPPTVSAYKYVQGEQCWTRAGDGLWSVDLSAGNLGRTHHGYVSSWTTEIGFLKVGTTFHGDRQTAVAALQRDWQFTSKGPVVTVRCAENPSVGGRRVWLAVAEPIVEGRSRLSVRDIAVLGTGRNAVQTGSTGRTEGFTISNCTIGEAGGGWASDGVSRMGNGVQVWSGASDVLVSGNSIVDCWDTAMTIQGPGVANAVTWSNIEFNGNTVERSMQTFEYWSTGVPVDGAGSTCSVRGNRASAAGSSWSAGIRPDRSGKGAHLLFYADGVRPQITVRGNVFSGASDAYVYANAGLPVGLTSDENTIALTSSTRLQWQRPERMAERAAWCAATGLERRSTFSAIP
nr:right-handed parallel beta-helix repeat-containing protein [Curtobacterium pusillum]